MASANPLTIAESCDLTRRTMFHHIQRSRTEAERESQPQEQNPGADLEDCLAKLLPESSKVYMAEFSEGTGKEEKEPDLPQACSPCPTPYSRPNSQSPQCTPHSPILPFNHPVPPSLGPFVGSPVPVPKSSSSPAQASPCSSASPWRWVYHQRPLPHPHGATGLLSLPPLCFRQPLGSPRAPHSLPLPSVALGSDSSHGLPHLYSLLLLQYLPTTRARRPGLPAFHPLPLLLWPVQDRNDCGRQVWPTGLPF